MKYATAEARARASLGRAALSAVLSAVLGAVLSAGPDRPTRRQSKLLDTGWLAARDELATWVVKAVMWRKCSCGGDRRGLDGPPGSS
jgi:hypothetical protein